MGIGVDVSDNFDFVLEADKEKPVETRRSIQFRYMSYSEFKKLDVVLTEARRTWLFDDAIKALQPFLVGWKNHKVEYTSESNIGDVLTYMQIDEVCETFMRHQSLDEISKKKSLRQSTSNTNNSVSDTNTPVAPV